jgi:hypothetical protein
MKGRVSDVAAVPGLAVRAAERETVGQAGMTVPARRASLDWADEDVLLHPCVAMFINQLFQEDNDECEFDDAGN